MISLFVLRLMPNVLGSPVSSTFTMLRIVSQHYLTCTSLSCPVNLYFSPGVLQLPSYWSLCFYDWPLECVLNPGVSMILIKQSVLCYFSAQTCLPPVFSFCWKPDPVLNRPGRRCLRHSQWSFCPQSPFSLLPYNGRYIFFFAVLWLHQLYSCLLATDPLTWKTFP